MEAGWWAPLRRGLFSDPTGKHFRKMGAAIWLYGHLHQVADWQTGRLLRTYRTLENETGIPERTLQRMMQNLRQHGYIQVTQLSRALSIEITKWKPISNKVRVANNGGGKSVEGRHICRQGSPHLTSPATSGEPLNVSNHNGKHSSPATSGEPIKSPLSKPNTYIDIFNFWNDQKIIVHREPEKFKFGINHQLKFYKVEELCRSIKNYADILNSPDHFFSYRWTLSDFLFRKNGLDQFMDRDAAFANFRKNGAAAIPIEPPPEETGEERVAKKREFEKAWAKSPAGKFKTESVTP